MRHGNVRLLKDVRFHNPRLTKVGVEVMSLRELRDRAGAALGTPERVDFHLLLLVEAGSSTHMVDFVEHELQVGTVLLVRPGQVHRWSMRPELEGHLVLVSGEALAPSVMREQIDMKLLALGEWPPTFQPIPNRFAQALAGAIRLRGDIAHFTGTEVEAAIIWHELLAMLLRLARESAEQVADAASSRDVVRVHRLFAQAIEAHFHERLSVLDYARRLGYSESTLSRACVSAVGHTAKHVLDLRIVLEAKRLLVHSDASVAQISHRLGFSEPTNFVKFFRRLASMRPLEFRAAHGAQRPLGRA